MTHEASKANRRLTNDEVRIMKERVFGLEARLIAFAVRVIKRIDRDLCGESQDRRERAELISRFCGSAFGNLRFNWGVGGSPPWTVVYQAAGEDHA